MNEPTITSNPRTIIQEVGEWAQRQPWHPRHAPDYGVVEEIGEFTHAILKNLQSIRGFDNPEFFREKATDALGDAMVFLSHWCYLKGCYYSLKEFKYVGVPDTMRTILAHLTIDINKLLLLSHNYGIGTDQALCVTVATAIASHLQEAAIYLGYDLMQDCLVPTWHKVKSRDWNKNKTTGSELNTYMPEIINGEEYCKNCGSSLRFHMGSEHCCQPQDQANAV